MRWFPLLLLLGCSTPAPTGAPEMELRTWTLPPGYAERLVGSLQRLFNTDGMVGRATQGPDGSLVVVGAKSVLDGVDVLVHQTTEHPAAATPRNVEVQYWLVQGVPSAEPSRGAGLEPLAAALDTIQKVDGPMALTLQDGRRLRSLDGDMGEVDDDRLEVKQTVGITPGGSDVVADVEITIPHAAVVRTRLALADGAVAVLSQTGGEAGTSLYVLIRPTIVQ